MNRDMLNVRLNSHSRVVGVAEIPSGMDERIDLDQSQSRECRCLYAARAHG
jgi:hypothetical protein